MKNKQKLKQALQELDALKEKVEGLMKPQLQVGRWYWKTCGKWRILFCYQGGNYENNFGFYGDGNWCIRIGNVNNNTSVLASHGDVETALVKEAKRRGLIEGATVKYQYNNTFKNINGSYVYRGNKLAYGGCIIFKNGKWEEVIEQSTDKFAELKEAHKNGAVIQRATTHTWVDDLNPTWDSYHEYSIKPEENPKVGDVVKAWCRSEEHYVVGNLTDIKKEYENKYGVHILGVSDIRNTIYYANARTLTKQESIELLFGKENEWNQTDLQTITEDIDTLKNKYPQYRFTITVEDNV